MPASALADPRSQYVMRKLPHVTVLFWALKIVAVTLGETAGDFLGITLRIGYLVAELIFLGFFLIVLAIQIGASRFRPLVFWAVVLGTSMVGTEISDFLDRGPGDGSAPRGVGYGWGALILITVLAIVLLAWRYTGQAYDVENIASRGGEILYWTAILASNTLGTASGDWLSDDTGLGFRNAFLAITAVMAVIVAAHYLTSVNGTLLFWAAFILTRPLGAAGGDSLVKPVAQGGLGWGTSWGSAALLILLLALIAYQAHDTRRHPLAPLPCPVSRRTGRPQAPNGAVVARPAARLSRTPAARGAQHAAGHASGATRGARPRP